jgi:glycosyltransferase involved in cell wall biosynthesis
MSDPEICLITHRFTIGGLERVVILLANGLAERGRAVQVVVLDATGLAAMITELDPLVTVHILRGTVAERVGRLRTLARGRIAHLHLAEGRIHPRFRAALRGHPATFVTYHSDYTPVRNRFTNRLDRAVTGRSRGVVAVSAAVRDFCLNEVRLPGVLVTTIENAVPPPAVSALRFEAHQGFALVALATVNPHKNYPLLVEGLAVARRRGHDVRLRVIGDGPAIAEVLETAYRLDVGRHVEWFGALWQTSIVSAILAASDVFVSASRNEGLPMSILEGLQHGLPMLLSDIPPHRQAAGDAGLYFSPDDPEQFVDRLEVLLTPDGHGQRADEARRRSALFDAKEFIQRHLDLYAGRRASPEH